MSFACADGVNVSDFSLLDPKKMAIRRRLFTCTIQAWEADIDIDNTIFDVHDISSVHDMNGGGKAEMACRSIGTASISVRAAFKARAWCT